MDLNGKNLVVAGGSSGIGAEIVRQASKYGANVLFSYNSGIERAEAIAGETGAHFRSLNLVHEDSIKSFLEGLKDTGPVDYFVANAGREFAGSLEKHSWQSMNEVVGANLVGNMYLLRNLVVDRQMRENGQITVVGSIASDGNKDQVAYASSKGGLRGLVGSLPYDSDFKAQGLGVKLLEPSFVRTSMAEKMLRVLERRIILNKGGPELVNEFKEKKYAMEVGEVASKLLSLTVDPSVTGVRQIPEGANLHEIRKRYID